MLGDVVDTFFQQFDDGRRTLRARGTRGRKKLQSGGSKIASAIEAHARRMRGSGSTERDMGGDENNTIDYSALGGAEAAFPLSTDDGRRFLRIVAGAFLIQRHYQLFRWLSGEIQEFLPHQVLISAWGDFAKWELSLDVVSAMPGTRTHEVARFPIDAMLRHCHAQWIAGGRRPQVVKAASLLETLDPGGVAFRDILSAMRCAMIHGVRDQRSGQESLYIALNSGSITRGQAKDQFAYVMDTVIGQVDQAFRRVAALPAARRSRVDGNGDWCDLSAREQEILDWLCQGKTNIDIAAALDISPFTVKNHVQRIFKKIGVNNRTQAAAKYSQAFRELRKYLQDKVNER
jgi:transcriptional regulator EpsA